MRILQKIFKENYDIFNSLNPNINIRDNANKMINCGNGDGILYACEDCLTFRYVPFTCKSRFCPSCCKIYSKNRSNTIQNKLIKC